MKMSTHKLNHAIDTAISRLSPRQFYAADVIRGYQRWSGADLKGKAKRYGYGYFVQRNKAWRAFRESGGAIVAVNRGLLVGAVLIGQDDYGNAIYDTTRGTSVQHTASTAKLIRK
jgi:hypothetical protein